jgi:hypothetical protein
VWLPRKPASVIAAWLTAGVKLALVVYPGSKHIAVYRSLRQVEVLTLGDTLELVEVLPGFACPVAAIFV